MFGFDRYGNRNITSGTGVTNFGFSGNRITTHSYDLAGNTINDGTGKTFTYDAENKQTLVNNGSTGQYSYDGDGKRVKKYVPTTGETTVFVYDASGKSIAEYSSYVEPTSTAKVAYTTADHLGTPRINTDQNGNITSRHDYRPFGEEILRTGNNYAADLVRKQFTGYERDNETDLDYAKARYQMSSQGRFMSADPYVIQFEMKRGGDIGKQAEMLAEYLADPRNHNRYVYALNNPIKYTDPSGMRPPNYWEQLALNKLDEIISATGKAGNKELATALTNAKAEISSIIDKLGKKQNSVPVGIAVFAILNLGDKKYADDQALAAPGYTYGAGENKCNVFVAMAHINGGGIKPGNYPSNNGKFAAANWLGDIRDSMKLENLPVHYGAAGVGDVVAWRNTDPGKVSGHSGVSIGGGAMIYAGGLGDGTPQVQTINHVNSRMNTEGTRVLGITIIGPSHEPGVVRRYNGKP